MVILHCMECNEKIGSGDYETAPEILNKAEQHCQRYNLERLGERRRDKTRPELCTVTQNVKMSIGLSVNHRWPLCFGKFPMVAPVNGVGS